jgi:hypothetical protein
MKIIYSTNELENAIDYLEQVNCYHERIEFKHRFKWLMISIHGALYGFCVLAVKGTNAARTVYKPLESFSKKRLGQIREEITTKYSDGIDDSYIDIYAQHEHGLLLAIYDVLDRCQDLSYMTQFSNSEALILNSEQQIAIDKMINFRNQFAHFKPSHYGITGDYDQEIIRPILEVIKFLALDCNNVMYYQDDQRERVEQVFSKLLTPKD